MIELIVIAIFIIWLISTELVYWKGSTADDLGAYTGKLMAMLVGAAITFLIVAISFLASIIIPQIDFSSPLILPIITGIIIIIFVFFVNTELYKRKKGKT